MKSETFRTFHNIAFACSLVWAWGQSLYAAESPINKNIAVIIGTPTKSTWAQASMTSLTDTFSQLTDQNFQVEPLIGSSQQLVLDRIKSLSARVSKDGTLAIAFVGNGIGSSFEMEDGSLLTYQQISKAIVEGRTNPLRRTIFLIDSTTEQNKSVIESQLIGHIDWFSQPSKHWQHLMTDKSRLKDSGLVSKSFFGEIVVFASTSRKQSNFARAVNASLSSLYSEHRENATFQHFADHLQKAQTLVFAVCPQESANSLLFDIAHDSTKTDPRYRTQGLGWLNQVSKRLSSLTEGCTFGPEDSINYSDSFLFDPSFIVTAKSGQVFHDMYFGTMNWLSNPDTTVQMLKDAIVKGESAQINALGCKLRPSE